MFLIVLLRLEQALDSQFDRIQHHVLIRYVVEKFENQNLVNKKLTSGQTSLSFLCHKMQW
jgi:hypothetical protein